MNDIKHFGHHGAVAAGLAALFTAAVLGARLAADAVIYVGALVMQ